VDVLFAIGGSLAIMTVAGLGMISPVVGAVVQNVGSLIVVVNSARLLRFEPDHLTAKAEPDGPLAASAGRGPS
jgi:cation transport ATPase